MANDIHVDPCPWHRNTKPTVVTSLRGHRDEPFVVITMSCPKCGAAQHYHPTDKEISEHGFTRASDNKPLMRALFPKLVNLWNWQK